MLYVESNILIVLKTARRHTTKKILKLHYQIVSQQAS